MFVVEEMRPQFRYSLISIKAVIISAVSANIVFRSINGQSAVITMPQYQPPELSALWLFLLLGVLFGIFGVIFNKLITLSQDMFVAIHKNDRKRYLMTGTLLGGCFGLLLLYIPELTGGGIGIIPNVTHGDYSTNVLLLIFLGRVLTTLLCFGFWCTGRYLCPDACTWHTLWLTHLDLSLRPSFLNSTSIRACLRLQVWGHYLQQLYAPR